MMKSQRTSGTTLTIDDVITRYQERINELEAENAALTLNEKLLNARLAAIRHWLKKIDDVAGYPVKPMSERALKL